MIKIWNISFLLISSIKQKLWVYNLLQSLLIFFWALSICNKKSQFNEISLENKDNLTPISVDTLWFANIVSSIIIFQSISLSSDRLFDFWFEIFFTIYLIQQLLIISLYDFDSIVESYISSFLSFYNLFIIHFHLSMKIFFIYQIRINII